MFHGMMPPESLVSSLCSVPPDCEVDVADCTLTELCSGAMGAFSFSSKFAVFGAAATAAAAIFAGLPLF